MVTASLADGRILSNEYETKLKTQWIPLVTLMFRKFGEDMITHDVRWAYNDVLKSLKKPRHKWTTKLIKTTGEEVSKTRSQYLLVKPSAQN